MPNNKYEDEIKEMEAKEEILQEVSSNTLLMPLRQHSWGNRGWPCGLA